MVPSTVVALIVVAPGDTAVTLPLASTVATLGLLDDQDTLLTVTLLGVTVAIRVWVEPTKSVNDVLFSVMPVAGIPASRVTVQMVSGRACCT